MPNTDLDLYRPRLLDYLTTQGVEYNVKLKKYRCPNPGHADKNPSCTLYADTNLLNCNVCGDKAWDIFDVVGMIEGLSDFKDQLNSLKERYGDGAPAARKKDSSQKPKSLPMVPITREKANEIFPAINTSLVETVKKFGWLSGDVSLIMNWPYRNAEGLFELFDIRFENEKGKKAVITFYWNGKALWAKDAPVLLYNRDLIAADTETPILIVEGAKTAEAAKLIPGFIPVTWNGGGKKTKKVDWSQLKGRKIYIYPDDDRKVNAANHPDSPGEFLPMHEQPGIATALDIKRKLPQARIITPLPDARKIKADGADIVEALEVPGMTPDKLAEYILSAPEITPPENPIDTPRAEIAPDAFPFRVLGVADDGKAYFLGRHERLVHMALGSITQNKLLMLASLTFWKTEFGTQKGVSRDEWAEATDAVIEIGGSIDFDPDRIRGRGAWRERDGRICYHNGLDTIGEPDGNRLYLRMSRKNIGLDSVFPALSDLTAVLEVTGELSFETRADMIRCIAWSTLAPFAGALPWRPAGLLTGRSESGKSTIVDMIIKPLSMPFVVSGGESTEAGVRQRVSINSTAIVVEEAETDTPKKRQRRDDILSLMRQSTSDETPKAVKGTIDGKGMAFTLRSMFMFVAISPEIESIADDNRVFKVNLEKNDNEWTALKQKLGETLTPELCAGVRAMTWARLNDILSLADRMSPVIQKITGKSARYALAESILFGAYQVIWKQMELSDDDLEKFFKQIYAWQPPEESRNEEEELLDKLLDHIIRDGRDNHTLREVLQKARDNRDDENSTWKDIAGRYGLCIAPGGDLAIGKNHDEIAKIISRGKGYIKLFWRHPLIKEKARPVFFAGKVRNCTTLDESVLAENPDENPGDQREGEPF